MLLLLLLSAHCAHYALLINTSSLFHNYRHTSNVLALNSILRSGGYREDNMVTLLKDEVLSDPRNVRAKLCVGGAALVPGVDFVHDGAGATYWDVLSCLSGRHRKLVGMDGSSTLVIYITGHGGELFIKYCNREYFYREDITRAILKIQEVRRIKKMLIIIDTCQADSLLDMDRISREGNITVIATSKVGESSLSANPNEAYGVYPIDLFIERLHTLHRQGDKLHKHKNVKLNELIAAEFTKDRIKATVVVYNGDVSYHSFFTSCA